MELRLVRTLSLIGAFALGAAIPASAFDYELYGNVRIQGHDFDPLYDYVDPTMTTSLSREGSRVGSLAGNQAEARWTADLALGSISGYAHGANAFADPVLGWRYANGDLQAWMKDTLTLQLPAGDYPQGAKVGLSGFVNGSLKSSGIDLFADATVRWKIELQRLDDYGYDSVEDSRQAANGEMMDVAEPFAPAFQVLSPGSSLATPKSVTFRFLAQLQVITDTYDSLADQHLEETADFEDTLQFFSVDAPPGTTWTSASGVFLPEPVAAAQAATALLALAALAGRRRRT
jgi:MYXO-CTERM domain-containing protein